MEKLTEEQRNCHSWRPVKGYRTPDYKAAAAGRQGGTRLGAISFCAENRETLSVLKLSVAS